MSYGFTEIDHLLGSAVDPQRGGEQYERLGFTVTPLSIIESIGCRQSHGAAATVDGQYGEFH